MVRRALVVCASEWKPLSNKKETPLPMVDSGKKDDLTSPSFKTLEALLVRKHNGLAVSMEEGYVYVFSSNNTLPYQAVEVLAQELIAVRSWADPRSEDKSHLHGGKSNNKGFKSKKRGKHTKKSDRLGPKRKATIAKSFELTKDPQSEGRGQRKDADAQIPR
ncbi:hypothetical protein Syun_014692 [Stephania yunnanensis]|uniref:Uncharacterized protein n=1 Tax=Stephania yunnanensis TaxID=152371 RepID=A0AAP0JM54_9MAGN